MTGTSAEIVEVLKERYSVRFRGAFENEVPARRLSVGDFRLDRWELTNAQFARFRRAPPPAKLPFAIVQASDRWRSGTV